MFILDTCCTIAPNLWTSRRMDLAILRASSCETIATSPCTMLSSLDMMESCIILPSVG